jgi:uncharacterized protein (TIGR03435 family)
MSSCHSRSTWTVALLTVACSTALFAGQTERRAETEPAFEVASVRENTKGDRPSSGFTPGRFSAVNVPLRNLIALSYGIRYRHQSHLMIGGSDQTLSRTFDVIATMASDVSEADALLMLRRLLRDRFALRSQLEPREKQIYELVLAKPGELGPGLRPSKHSCETYRAAINQGIKIEPPTNTRNEPLCVRTSMGFTRDGIEERWAGDMSSFIQRIQGWGIDRLIIDRTGLEGYFAWTFRHAPRLAKNSAFPSLFVALEEELGLRLRPATATVDVLVISSVGMPDPN